MVFVTADRCRARLERLTRLLVAAFPGSTIYQHTELLRVPHDVLNHNVDAVLLEAAPDALELAGKLRRRKPNVPVFFTADAEASLWEAGASDADGCFILPEGEPRLLEALRGTNPNANVS